MTPWPIFQPMILAYVVTGGNTQVRHQLDAGTAVLVYDEATESCTIQPTD